MAVEESGGNGAISTESVSDLIGEFARTEYAKVVEAVALASGFRGEAEDAVQVAALRVLAEGRPANRLGLPVTVMASRLISRRHRPRDVRGWAERVFSADREESQPVGTGALRRSISELSRGQRLVSLLHYYLDYPVAEIAQALRLPRIVVATRLHLARSRLKVLVEEVASR